MIRRLRPAAVPLLAALAVSACTSANDVLEPSAISKQQAAAAPSATEGTATTPPAPAASTTATMPAPINPAQLTAAIAQTKLQIAPIVGATVEAATPLSERLNARAKERGIQLAASTDPSATHVLKGYFSAVTEGKDTTVIYVWDIYDPAGNRLHRINGQQKAPTANGGDGWTAVSPQTMQTIADTTIEQFTTWLGGRAS